MEAWPSGNRLFSVLPALIFKGGKKKVDTGNIPGTYFSYLEQFSIQ